MMPDLPMPVTMTRPWHSCSILTARSKFSSRRSISATMAAASICSTFLASDRSVVVLVGISNVSGARPLFGVAVDGVEAHQTPDERFDAIERQRVLRVALGRRRVIVDLDEEPVYARRDSGCGQRLDVLSLAGCYAVS